VGASSFRHVLALLDDDSCAMCSVLDRAIELAGAEHARLTLAKTTDPGWVTSCLCAYGALAGAVPLTDAELQERAGHRLARAAEFVPGSISLTTVVLGRDTPSAVRRLAEGACYDLLVVSHRLLAHSRRLRRVVKRLGISMLTVSLEPAPRLEPLAGNAFGPRPAAQA
jgi:Universal stress protein family